MVLVDPAVNAAAEITERSPDRRRAPDRRRCRMPAWSVSVRPRARAAMSVGRPAEPGRQQREVSPFPARPAGFRSRPGAGRSMQTGTERHRRRSRQAGRGTRATTTGPGRAAARRAPRRCAQPRRGPRRGGARRAALADPAARRRRQRPAGQLGVGQRRRGARRRPVPRSASAATTSRWPAGARRRRHPRDDRRRCASCPAASGDQVSADYALPHSGGHPLVPPAGHAGSTRPATSSSPTPTSPPGSRPSRPRPGRPGTTTSPSCPTGRACTS